VTWLEAGTSRGLLGLDNFEDLDLNLHLCENKSGSLSGPVLYLNEVLYYPDK